MFSSWIPTADGLRVPGLGSDEPQTRQIEQERLHRFGGSIVPTRRSRISGADALLHAAEFPTENRAGEKVVNLTFQAVQAEESGDLWPVTKLVQDDVGDNLPGRRSHQELAQGELARVIPLVTGERRQKCPKVGATPSPELEQWLDLGRRYRSGIGQWATQQPVHVAQLGREDVLDEAPDSLESAIPVRAGCDGEGLGTGGPKPDAPLVTLPLGVRQQIVKIQVQWHEGGGEIGALTGGGPVVAVAGEAAERQAATGTTAASWRQNRRAHPEAPPAPESDGRRMPAVERRHTMS